MNKYSDKLKETILNFNIEKKKIWARERKPYSAFIELTPRCNMNCVHCYLQDQHALEEMPYEKVIEIIDILYNKGIIFLTLSGGEIFTRTDFIDIYVYAKRKGFMIELFTNGLGITDEIVEVLKKYPPLLIDISLYGACENTYKLVTGVDSAFKKVIHNCNRINNANIRMSLKTPIIKETYSEVLEMRAIADNMGVPFCVSYGIDVTIDNNDKTKKHQLSVENMLRCEFNDYEMYNKNVNNTDTDVDDIYKIEDNSIFICNVAQNSFIIDYEGRMCPCMKFRHRGKKLRKDNFDEIWKDFGELQKLKASKTYKCSGCAARYYCDACAAEREFMYGNLEAINEESCKYAIARHEYYRKKKSVDEVISLLK